MKKVNNNFISVIVPCFNTGKLIENLLYSLLNQTYKNFEIIMVDDGSTDCTKDFIDKFLSENNSLDLKYFYKKNGGVSSARNFGLEKANGDFIIFLDSDDIVIPTLLEELITSQLIKNSDLVISNASVERNGITSELPISIVDNNNIDISHLIISIFASSMAYKKYNFNYNFGRSVCSKLYRKSIIDENRIRFDNRMYLFEDGFFNLNYLKYSNTISCTLSSLYIYKIELGNSTKFRENIISENDYKINKIKEYVGDNIELKDANDIFNIDLFFSFVKSYIVSKQLPNNLFYKSKLMKSEYRKKYSLSFNYKIFKYLNLKKKFLFILIKLHLFALVLCAFKKRG